MRNRTLARILVVDDESDVRDLYLQKFRKKIESGDFEFYFSLNGQGALEILNESEPFQIVLLDINMPVMDGLTLLSKILEKFPDTTAIMVSAYGDMKNLRSAMNSGAFDFVLKPIDFHDLEVTIYKTLEHLYKMEELRHLQSKTDLLKAYNQHLKKELSDQRQNLEGYKLSLAVFENMYEGVVITDLNGIILSVNPAFSQITGYDPPEVIGKKTSVLRSHRHESGFYKNLWNGLIQNGFWQGEIWNRKKSGEIFPEWLSIVRINGANNEPDLYVGVFTDITGRKDYEEKIKLKAYHDALTGLPNRLLLEDRLRQSLAHAERENKILAIMFIDLDNFKHVNDTAGHKAGDDLLQNIARFLQNSLRQTDTAARYGGDEFLLVINDLESESNAEEFVKKLLTGFHEKFRTEVDNWKISLSIGISLFPKHGKEGAALVELADQAMYQAKKSGKNKFCYWSG